MNLIKELFTKARAEYRETKRENAVPKAELLRETCFHP